MAGFGVLAGLLAAPLLTPVLASYLFEVGPREPRTLAAAALILVGTALLAGYLPARRASKVTPAENLRIEA